MRRVFILEENQEFGGAGLRPQWIRDADAYTGMAIPHDILEHSLKEPGPVEGEFMALGASIFVRGEGGYWAASYSSPAKNIGSDLPDIWGRVARGDQYLRPFPHRSCAIWGGYAEDTIAEVLQEFRRLDREGERRYYPEDGQRGPRQDDLKTIAAWMRNGYRLARRRYADYNACHMTYLFQQIEKEADRVVKFEEAMGQEVVFSVNVRRCACKVRVVEPDYY